jgi:hypothetical protein
VQFLFVMRHAGIGSLAPMLRLLGERGHEVRLAVGKTKHEESARAIREVVETCPGVTTVELPAIRRGKGWPDLARQTRITGNYLRYLEPRYRAAPLLRERAEEKAPPFGRSLGRVAAATGRPGVAFARQLVEAAERSLAPAPEVVAFLREQRPDVLLVAHVVLLDGGEADYLRAARQLGIRTAFPVRGWDNLTNKGLLRDAPDRLLVWNDIQAWEARELHHVPPENISVTGAPKCDPLFDWRSRRSRDGFCREIGLRSDRPIVLYVGSSPFVAPREVDFVRRWIGALRAGGGAPATAGILIRPHPRNAAQWTDAAFDDPQVAVWPRAGETPQDHASQDNYYDSIHHAAAVVGINTTAQVESAILGRPVHTVLAQEFAQEGTLHFHYLRDEEYGHLIVGRTLEEHAAQLGRSLAGEWDRSLDERFLSRFVRPLGLDVNATERLVGELEALAAGPAPAPRRDPVYGPLFRLALRPVAARQARARRRRKEAAPGAG